MDDASIPEPGWFTLQRQERALSDAFVFTYEDADTGKRFYAVDTFDLGPCAECRDETEMIEEVDVEFQENREGDLEASIIRLKAPRLFCRECLTSIDLD